MLMSNIQPDSPMFDYVEQISGRNATEKPKKLEIKPLAVDDEESFNDVMLGKDFNVQTGGES
jgi:hypothetical protein